MANRIGLLVFVSAVFLPGLALAQAAPVPEDSPPPGGVVLQSGTAGANGTAQVQAAGPRYTGPTLWVLGIPVRMDAPVAPYYAGTAYTTFAGQPQTGLDAVMAQTPGAEPQR
jgi:hypothetical protein